MIGKKERRSLFIQSLKEGLKKGASTTWMLARIILPIYFVVKILEYTKALTLISGLFEPIMQLFHLPGEAALALVLGNGLNLYAGIGVMKALTLDSHQITTLSLMLVFSHSLIMETAVVKRLNISASKIMLMRVAMMLLTGLIYGGLIGRMAAA
ncbi:MAG: nucleoside recognition domain-containing protein [Peptostreptococcaceae bacterium]|nr:nucleoside recognition domain-containing protein [Peptostreptococcaceae bacterium]